jgi:hypothetical protein
MEEGRLALQQKWEDCDGGIDYCWAVQQQRDEGKAKHTGWKDSGVYYHHWGGQSHNSEGNGKPTETNG